MSKVTRRLVWGLALSVGLNLFVLGYLVAKGTRGPLGEDRRGARARGGAPPMFSAPELLGSVQTPGVRGLQKRFRQELRGERKALRRARKRVRKALSEEPLDEVALVEALQVLRSRTQGTQTKLHDTLVDFARTLTFEQRERLANSQFNDKRRRRKKRGAEGEGEHQAQPAER